MFPWDGVAAEISTVTAKADWLRTSTNDLTAFGIDIGAGIEAQISVDANSFYRVWQTNGTANGAPGTMIVRGLAPMSELSGYQIRLNALTSGQGRYMVELSHYEAVPPNVQTQLMAQYKSQDDD